MGKNGMKTIISSIDTWILLSAGISLLVKNRGSAADLPILPVAKSLRLLRPKSQQNEYNQKWLVLSDEKIIWWFKQKYLFFNNCLCNCLFWGFYKNFYFLIQIFKYFIKNKTKESKQNIELKQTKQKSKF